ncbi:MAG: alpha/beta hydrolase [Treponemataceae bacterium]
MNTVEYRIESGKETLACSVDYSADRLKPSVISLHGGGPSSRRTTRYLSSVFQNVGKSVVRFDFSGQGDSSGEMHKSSLKKRFHETLTVLDFFGVDEGLTVIGTSMGGYIAAAIARKIPIKNLILFCPAAYSTDAWDVEFGSGFTEIIREKDSFLRTDIAASLESFQGRALLITGSEDEIIPKPVIDLYTQALSCKNGFEAFVIESCPHPIHRWADTRPDVRKNIEDTVLRFIKA